MGESDFQIIREPPETEKYYYRPLCSLDPQLGDTLQHLVLVALQKQDTQRLGLETSR